MIVLVRRVRVRPRSFSEARGRRGAAAVTSASAPASTPADAANAPKPAAPSSDNFVDRVRNFVRKLWPSDPNPLFGRSDAFRAAEPQATDR